MIITASGYDRPDDTTVVSITTLGPCSPESPATPSA